MPAPKKSILEKMLDRLFAGLASGPNLNCRPHSSRQRVDWTQLARLQDLNPADALRQLLSDKQSVQLKARVEAPKKAEKPPETKKRSRSGSDSGTKSAESANDPIPKDTVSLEEQKQRDDWAAQQSLLNKLRGLAEDAREYEQDTGVHVLHVGFPLLSLPPGVSGMGGTKRLLAPISFVSVSLELQAGPHPVVRIEGLRDGADFLVPNEALFAWLERQTGKQILPGTASAISSAVSSTDVTANAEQPNTQPATDGDGEPNPNDNSNTPATNSVLDPWQELNDLVRRVSDALHVPGWTFAADTLSELRSAPRADDEIPRAEIVPGAVIGLFPMNNQGLLRDMQQMVGDRSLHGPVQSFLTLDAELEASPNDQIRSQLANSGHARPRQETERLISLADPCQARAVRLARECKGLVVHGPPGTGKSQTITNMIGDHLVRGQRVLLVCDKRTALDVVFRRLDHLGLGALCALIHDPQHDQRNLYKQVKEQLEALPSAKTRDRAQARLDRLDVQLQKSFETLTAAWSMVMDHDPQRSISFHERMGEWLEAREMNGASGSNRGASAQQLTDDAPALNPTPKSQKPAVTRRANETPILNPTGNADKPAVSVAGRRAKSGAAKVLAEPVSVTQFQAHEHDIREIVTRAAIIRFAGHPWRRCVGIPLADFLQRPGSQVRDDMDAIIDCSRTVDATLGKSILHFAVPTVGESVNGDATPSCSTTSFVDQGSARGELAERLRNCLIDVDPVWRRRWAKASPASVERARTRFDEVAADLESIHKGPLDAQFLLTIRDRIPPMTEILGWIADLDAYLGTRGTWYAWVAIHERSKADQVLRSFGLTLGYPNAERLRTFLSGVGTRFLMASLLDELSGSKTAVANPLDDETLFTDWDRFGGLLETLQRTRTNPALSELSEGLRQSLVDGDQDFVERLDASALHAESLEDLRCELEASRLFHSNWLSSVLDRVCRGESVNDELLQLKDRMDTLVDVLRIDQTLNQLPASLRALTERVIAGTSSVETALKQIRHQVLSDDISGWLKSNRELQTLDGPRLNDLIQDVRRQQQEKQDVVRDRILDIWINRQRERLLASTGTRLNGRAADLRRRLTTRGERAMRLRQVISAGARVEEGDPLFDLRPVWMASPETVAQIFPREELFDVVIFDEASQCRLEEALPVLTRAKRVVIAGDPKQLPPTRFFESALVTSDNAAVETEHDLFESHQSEIEDLLTAALSLEIQECYLDVHYRSRNADLVEFSNEQFYGSRLQAIPGHPKNRVRFAPITLYQVGGIYDERCNEKEALKVCQIVADLLRRAEPPSIGIACFNLTQRDLILEKLTERCSEDNDFAGKLASARSRIGSGAFEGLFVKNLENVQGDERDHMIISTTYGVDKQGRFYKRFGPLGQAGGGRRLNVLVTRARDEVHLVTSIPPEQYRNLPPIPKGQQPGGGWLLFKYLAYAEELAEHYQSDRGLDSLNRTTTANVVERPSHTPSVFAREVARLVAQNHQIGSDVHWGNDGFCVDVAFHDPSRPDDRTLGLLCDGTRFQHADDPVEWDLFRTMVLEAQGWQLTRCWSPEFFRDPERFLTTIVKEVNRIAEEEPDSEAIPVEPE